MSLLQGIMYLPPALLSSCCTLLPKAGKFYLPSSPDPFSQKQEKGEYNTHYSLSDTHASLEVLITILMPHAKCESFKTSSRILVPLRSVKCDSVSHATRRCSFYALEMGKIRSIYPLYVRVEHPGEGVAVEHNL